jgi:hypothetical protein
MYSTGAIAQIITARIEPLEPQTSILKFLQEQNGKRLTNPVIAKLREVCNDETIHLRQAGGMTSIGWGYEQSGQRTGSLLVSYKTKNVVIDAEFVEEKNPAYFSAARERNHRRSLAVKDTKGCAELEATIHTLLAAQKKLDEFFAFGTHFEQDKFAIRKAFGVE